MRLARCAACAAHIRPSVESVRFALGLVCVAASVAPPPVVAAPASLGAPVPSTSPHRKPVEHKQRGREIPPACAGGQERCALREGLQDAETANASRAGEDVTQSYGYCGVTHP